MEIWSLVTGEVHAPEISSRQLGGVVGKLSAGGKALAVSHVCIWKGESQRSMASLESWAGVDFAIISFKKIHLKLSLILTNYQNRLYLTIQWFCRIVC